MESEEQQNHFLFFTLDLNSGVLVNPNGHDLNK